MTSEVLRPMYTVFVMLRPVKVSRAPPGTSTPMLLFNVDRAARVKATEGRHSDVVWRLRSATAAGDVMSFSTIVLYEWLRGTRTPSEEEPVNAFFERDRLSAFGPGEAKLAAMLYRRVKRARQRQADLAIAASAIEHSAALWTLSPADFEGIEELKFYER